MKKGIVNTAVFLGILVLGLVFFLILPKKSTDDIERRALANAPSFSVSGVLSGKFFDGVDDYISDHFPLRAAFVCANGYIKAALGNISENGVYQTTDGHLVLSPSVPDKSALSENINDIKSFIKQAGVKAQILPVPEAGYIMSDKIKGFHAPYDDSVYNALSQCAQVIDVRKALENVQNPYFKTDHHWTTPGAYAAYGEFCKANRLSVRSREDYKKSTISGFRGTTWAKSGLLLKSGEEIELWDNQNKVTVTRSTTAANEQATKINSCFDLSFADSADKYSVFLGGNYGKVKIKSEKKGPKLLIIKDSFANSFAPFLTDHYSEIYMIDLRYYRNCDIAQMVKENNIDGILFMLSAEKFSQNGDFAFLK